MQGTQNIFKNHWLN